MEHVIRALASIAIIIFALTGCDDRTPEQIQADRQAAIEQRSADATLIAVVEGLKIYSVWDGRMGQMVYFTVPCGDTGWQSGGKAKKTHLTVGAGCRQ